MTNKRTRSAYFSKGAWSTSYDTAMVRKSNLLSGGSPPPRHSLCPCNCSPLDKVDEMLLMNLKKIKMQVAKQADKKGKKGGKGGGKKGGKGGKKGKKGKGDKKGKKKGEQHSS